jgi:hypothetical protein
MPTPIEINLPIPDVQWAAETARASFARWQNQRGYYNNRFNSHFTGKLGELAVEKFLLRQNLKLDSHFRFSDRENLADIVVKIRGYNRILRLEVKTWNREYWQELGRCISVQQFPDLKKKADLIVWCVTDAAAALTPPKPVAVLLAGWSNLEDVSKAPTQFTGLDAMRKIENHQLAETDLRRMSDFPPLIL